jgi:ribosomal protein S25
MDESETDLSKVYRLVADLRADVDRRLGDVVQLLHEASSGFERHAPDVRNVDSVKKRRARSAGGPISDELTRTMLELVPSSGWIKVSVLVKSVPVRNAVAYAALRALVASGTLARRRSSGVARRDWLRAGGVEM